MNEKLNILEQILPLEKNYSLWADLKVNGWLMLVWPTILGGDLWFYNHDASPFWLRVIIALLPPVMCLLWIRSVARWIRGMDELQRRITLEACLFAITWTFFIVATWLHHKHMGILEALFRSHFFLGKLVHGFDLGGLTEYDFYYPLVIGLLACFYFLGHIISNRRYK